MARIGTDNAVVEEEQEPEGLFDRHEDQLKRHDIEVEPIDVRRLRIRLVHTLDGRTLVGLSPSHQPSHGYLLVLFAQHRRSFCSHPLLPCREQH